MHLCGNRPNRYSCLSTILADMAYLFRAQRRRRRILAGVTIALAVSMSAACAGDIPQADIGDLQADAQSAEAPAPPPPPDGRTYSGASVDSVEISVDICQVYDTGQTCRVQSAMPNTRCGCRDENGNILEGSRK